MTSVPAVHSPRGRKQDDWWLAIKAPKLMAWGSSARHSHTTWKTAIEAVALASRTCRHWDCSTRQWSYQPLCCRENILCLLSWVKLLVLWGSLIYSWGGGSSPTQHFILHWQWSHHWRQPQSDALSESYLCGSDHHTCLTYPVSVSTNHCRIVLSQPLWLFTFKLLKETEMSVPCTNHLIQELTVHIWLGCTVLVSS